MDAFELHRQVADRLVRTPVRIAQSPLRIAQLLTAEPGETPYDVVLDRPTFQLRRYEPTGADRRELPLVIVYPFINDPSILDFAPTRSVIGGFLEAGFPVYVFEWTEASPVQRSIGLGDYVERYLRECVDVALGETGADEAHLLGYSTSAPVAAAYAAVHPDTLRTLILRGPPLDFDAGDAVELLRTLAIHQDLELVADVFEVVPTEVLELALAARKPVHYGVRDPLRLWDRLDDDAYVEETGRKLHWLIGGPTLPVATVRDFLVDLLVENRLIRNKLELNGRRVDLGDVVAPVLLVLGRDDEFIPREASVPFLEGVSSEDTEVIEFPTGHVGLSVAPQAHEEGWPRVREWLIERS